MAKAHHEFKKLISTALACAAISLSSAGCTKQTFGLAPENASFGQKATFITDVDILWVIDTSGSMGPRQAGLAAQLGGFISNLNATRLNYQMAVTTMDMGSAGARGRWIAQSGTPFILKADTPDLLSLLQGRIMAGDQGSVLERGMESVRAALTPPLVDGVNKGFMRKNSLLVVIFLSDENDKSAVFDDVAFLDSIHPPLPFGDKSWVVQFMGVTPDDPSCKTSEWGYSEPGVRYINMAQASGGAAESICDADFGRALTNVNARLKELLVEFPLDRLPNVDTIQVFVNGKKVPKSDTNGWSYVEAKNSIRFHGEAVPGPDASINVDFTPQGAK